MSSGNRKASDKKNTITLSLKTPYKPTWTWVWSNMANGSTWNTQTGPKCSQGNTCPVVLKVQWWKHEHSSLTKNQLDELSYFTPSKRYYFTCEWGSQPLKWRYFITIGMCRAYEKNLINTNACFKKKKGNHTLYSILKTFIPPLLTYFLKFDTNSLTEAILRRHKPSRIIRLSSSYKSDLTHTPVIRTPKGSTVNNSNISFKEWDS